MRKSTPCPKCSGQKHIAAFSHVANGVCFACKGAGVVFCDDAQRELSPETRHAAEWLLRASAETFVGWSYNRLNRARTFAHGGWGVTEAYPELLAHWRVVGDPAFFAAQEVRLAGMNTRLGE